MAYTLTYWDGPITRPNAPATSPSSTPSATAGWLPFSSSDGAFSFKRPASWALYGPCMNSGQVLGDPSAIEVRVGPDLTWDSCGSDLVFELEIDGYAKNGPAQVIPSCDPPLTSRTVVVDGMTGKRTAGRCNGSAFLSYYFRVDGRVYELWYSQQVDAPDGSSKLGPDITATIDLMMQQTWAFHG